MVSVIWYAVRCEAGNEDKTAEKWKQKLIGQCGEAFVFTYEKMKRYEGSWHLIREPLFAGYVFLVIKDQAIPEIEDAQSLIPVGAEEVRFLEEIGGREHHIPMSRGYIKEGVTCVTEGPLCGREGQIRKIDRRQIRKIDRHKRLARLECPVDQYQRKGLWAGLEIVSKS